MNYLDRLVIPELRNLGDCAQPICRQIGRNYPGAFESVVSSPADQLEHRVGQLNAALIETARLLTELESKNPKLKRCALFLRGFTQTNELNLSKLGSLC